MKCPDCGVDTVAHASHQARCKPCVTKRTKEKATAARRVREAAAKQAKVDNPLPVRAVLCERCQLPVKWASRKRFCSSCAKVRKLERENERMRDPDQRKRRAEISREYAIRNPEKIRAKSLTQRQRNKGKPRTEAMRARLRNWERERRKTDPVFALNKRMSCAVRRDVKNGWTGRSWKCLVGYGPAELREHLERQFLRGMTWDNMGQWHIDHIVPLDAFNYINADDPAFRAAWALTNLRPLWAADNVRKHAKRLHLI